MLMDAQRVDQLMAIDDEIRKAVKRGDTDD